MSRRALFHKRNACFCARSSVDTCLPVGGERLLGVEKGVFYKRNACFCARSSVDRASGCGPEGRRFDSCRAHINTKPSFLDGFCICQRIPENGLCPTPKVHHNANVKRINHAVAIQIRSNSLTRFKPIRNEYGKVRRRIILPSMS